MWFGGLRNVDPEHGPKGGNQDSVVLPINTNDWTVEAFILGKAGGRYQADEEEIEEDDK